MLNLSISRNLENKDTHRVDFKISNSETNVLRFQDVKSLVFPKLFVIKKIKIQKFEVFHTEFVIKFDVFLL